MNDKNRAVLYDYLLSHNLMSLATASSTGVPEVATVRYVMDGDFILINTLVHYRKYANVLVNPKVACVITDGESATLQLDADIIELHGSEAGGAKAKMLASDPSHASYFDDESTRFFQCLHLGRLRQRRVSRFLRHRLRPFG